MDQLKRTMLYMCTFYLPASLSASGFQGAGRQNPGSSQSCARPICLHWLTFSSHYGWALSSHILSASLFLKLLHFSIGFLWVSSSLNPWQAKNGFSGMLSWFIKLNSYTKVFWAIQSVVIGFTGGGNKMITFGKLKISTSLTFYHEPLPHAPCRISKRCPN
jgi:hypothetical protein